MNNLVIPPSPNWYESRILACAADNTIIYGAKNEIVVIEPQPYDKPADVKIIPHSPLDSSRVTSIDVNLNWGVGNKWVVSAGEDKNIKLWNLEDYSNKYTNTAHTSYSDKLVGAVFAGNDKVIAASENGFISVWRILTDEVTPLKNAFIFKVQITTLSACPHSSWLMAFGLKCGLIVIADIRKNGKVLYKMRGHDKSVVSLSWCPVPFNVFPQNTVRKIIKKNFGKEDVKNEEDVSANNDGNNAEVNEKCLDLNINEGESNFIDISANNVDTIKAADLENNLACDKEIENPEKDKNCLVFNVNAEDNTETNFKNISNSNQEEKTEIAPADIDTKICSDRCNTACNDKVDTKFREQETNEPISLDTDINTCDDLKEPNRRTKPEFQQTQSDDVLSTKVNTKTDDDSNSSAMIPNKEIDDSNLISENTNLLKKEFLLASSSCNSISTAKFGEQEDNELLSVDTVTKTCDALRESNNGIKAFEETQSDDVLSTKVDTKIEADSNSSAMIPNKEIDDSNLISENTDPLKKAFLLASSSCNSISEAKFEEENELSVNTVAKTCGALGECINGTNPEFEETQSSDVLSANADTKIDTDINKSTGIPKEELDGSNLICENSETDQLKKELLSTSSSCNSNSEIKFEQQEEIILLSGDTDTKCNSSTNPELEETQSNKVLSPKVDASIDNDANRDTMVQNRESDDSNLICVNNGTNQLKKEFLLASSSKGGSICIWRAGTDGRKQIELYLSNNRNKRKYKSTDKNWITLCWIAPHILLSSSSFGELLQWDLSKFNKETNIPQKKLVHHDHGNNLFVIAAPIKLCTELQGDNWRNRRELFAWSFGQERFLLCTSLQPDRTTYVSYPTIGGFIYCLASSPLDPTRLAVGIGDNTAKIWDLSRPHLQCVLMTNLWQKIQSKVLTLAWHPTKEAILAYATFEGRIGLINSNNSSKLPTLLNQHFRTAVHKITWGPLNGNMNSLGLYACGEGELTAYDTEKPTGEPKLIKIGTKEHVTSMCWKPDYSLFCVSTKIGSIFVFNLNLEQVTTIYGQHKSILNILWHPEATAADNETSPYSSWFAASTTDASILVYDLSKEKGSGGDEKEDYRLFSVLKGHSKPVRCLCWSSYEGAKLVSGGDDGVAQVWDVSTGNIISTFIGHNLEAILAVLWSPLDKDFIITGGKDNCIRIWKIDEHKPMTDTELEKMTEILRLKQGWKKYKKPEESDEKVKRSAMLSITASRQNNTEKVLEDCRRMFLMQKEDNLEDLIQAQVVESPNENHFDTTKLFGDRNNVLDLLESEQEKHIEKKKYLSSQYISLWKGDIAETLKEAIKNGTVNPWLISMAPMVSPKLWHEACEVYAMKLIETNKSDPLEIVSYLLACHKIEEAINVLCNATLFREALALAKCRLSKDDPTINDTLSKWATFAVVHGAYEVAAQCFIALNQYEEATKALFKRSDEKTLEFALQLADKSGNKDLKDAIIFRYNSFKISDSKVNESSLENCHDTQSVQIQNNAAFEEENNENESSGCNQDENIAEKILNFD